MTWIAVRSHRVGVLGLIAFLGTFGLLEVGSFARLNATPAEQQQFAVLMQNIGRATSYMVQSPEALGTVAGYVQWFLIGFIPVFFSAWAVIAGTGAGRGDEDRGLVEQWLGWGLPRVAYVASRIVAFAIAVLAAVLGVDLIVLGADLVAGHKLDAVGVVLQSIAQGASALPVFAAGMLAAELVVSRGTAAGALGFLVGAMYFLNGFSRSISWLRPFRWITPYAYADRSDAMVPGGHFDGAATGVLLASTIVVGAAAAWLMTRRDLGDAILPTRRDAHVRHDFDGSSITTLPVLCRLWDQRVGLLVWMGAVGAYAVTNVPLARPFVQSVSSSTGLNRALAATALGAGGPDPLAGYVSSVWFRAACLLMAIYAITQAARWAGEDAEGRLEWLLSLGRARWQVAIERAIVLVGGLSLIAAGDFAGVLVGGWAGNLNLDPARVALGAAMTIPLGVAFGAAGATIAAWRPRVAVASLIGVLGVSYMIPFAAVPIFKTPPDWFLDLSAFHLYGSPMTDGIDRTGTAILVAAGVVGFGAAFAALQRRDVGS